MLSRRGHAPTPALPRVHGGGRDPRSGRVGASRRPLSSKLGTTGRYPSGCASATPAGRNSAAYSAAANEVAGRYAARRSEGAVAAHEHPVQAAMLAVIVIEAGFVQRGAVIDDQQVALLV